MPLIGSNNMSDEEYSLYLITADKTMGIKRSLDRVSRLYGSREIRLHNALEARKQLDELIFYLGGTEDEL